MDCIVQELRTEEKSPVIDYKAQGTSDPDLSVPTDTFLLAIMTKFQAEMFNAFPERIACLDSTHCSNQCRLELVTLKVEDEFRNGCVHIHTCFCTPDLTCAYFYTSTHTHMYVCTYVP